MVYYIGLLLQKNSSCFRIFSLLNIAGWCNPKMWLWWWIEVKFWKSVELSLTLTLVFGLPSLLLSSLPLIFFFAFSPAFYSHPFFPPHCSASPRTLVVCFHGHVLLFQKSILFPWGLMYHAFINSCMWRSGNQTPVIHAIFHL